MGAVYAERSGHESRARDTDLSDSSTKIWGDGDGVCSRRDLKQFGVAPDTAKARFFINP